MAHRQCLGYITPHHNPPANNARVHTMRGPFPPLSLKPIFPSNIISLRLRINGNRVNNFSMGDKATTEKKKEETEPEKLVKEIPPPPEKPEPGDCCGSGCVRCVWDVYYDELEEYNKLNKSDSTSNS